MGRVEFGPDGLCRPVLDHHPRIRKPPREGRAQGRSVRDGRSATGAGARRHPADRAAGWAAPCHWIRAGKASSNGSRPLCGTAMLPAKIAARQGHRLPMPSGPSATSTSRSSQAAIQLVRRGGPAKRSRSNQRGHAGAGASGSIGDDLEIELAKTEEPVMGGHVADASRPAQVGSPSAASTAPRRPPASGPKPPDGRAAAFQATFARTGLRRSDCASDLNRAAPPRRTAPRPAASAPVPAASSSALPAQPRPPSTGRPRRTSRQSASPCRALRHRGSGRRPGAGTAVRAVSPHAAVLVAVQKREAKEHPPRMVEPAEVRARGVVEADLGPDNPDAPARWCRAAGRRP